MCTYSSATPGIGDLNNVEDPKRFDTDPDPTFHFDPGPHPNLVNLYCNLKKSVLYKFVMHLF